MLRYFFVEKRLAIWNTAKRFCSFHTPCDLYLPFLDSNKERNKDFHMYCFLMILIIKDYYINSEWRKPRRQILDFKWLILFFLSADLRWNFFFSLQVAIKFPLQQRSVYCSALRLLVRPESLAEQNTKQTMENLFIILLKGL